VTQSIISSIPQNTGGLLGSVNIFKKPSGTFGSANTLKPCEFFGSANTSSQPNGLFSSELFGKKQPQNGTNHRYDSSNNMTTKPT
jgi:hypothetical protein